MTRYRGISAFAAAFAAEYSGFMKTHRVTNLQIAEKLGRNDGYVSERATGKRPLDTDDVDALASLVPGWSGRALMIELAGRTRVQMSAPSGRGAELHLADHQLVAYIYERTGDAQAVTDAMDRLAHSADGDHDVSLNIIEKPNRRRRGQSGGAA